MIATRSTRGATAPETIRRGRVSLSASVVGLAMLLAGATTSPGSATISLVQGAPGTDAVQRTSATPTLPAAPATNAAQETSEQGASATPTLQDAPGTDPVLERLDSLAAAVRELARVQDSLARRGASFGPDSTAADSAGVTGASGPDLGRIRGTAQNWILRSLVAVVILVATYGLVWLVSWLLDALAEQSAKRRLLYKRLVPIARVILWVVSILFILFVVFALSGDTILAAGAGLGVAIGFAAQDLLKNIFGGFVIIGDRPFQVGDKVSVGETYGEVKSIGLRSTKIQTPDDNLVTVPNSIMLSGQVSNANSGALDCQVVTDLYLPGWVDTRRAKEIAYRAAVTSRYVYLKKPVVVIVKDEVRHTFLTHLRVKAYVQDIRHEFLFMSDVTDRARAAFVEAGLLPAWHGATALAGVEGDLTSGRREAAKGAARR